MPAPWQQRPFKTTSQNSVVETRRLGPLSGPSSDMCEGDIDLLLASPECTNHSPAKGSKRRSEKSRQTSAYFINFARKLRPRWIVLENVVQIRLWGGYKPVVRIYAGSATRFIPRYWTHPASASPSRDVGFSSSAI